MEVSKLCLEDPEAGSVVEWFALYKQLLFQLYGSSLPLGDHEERGDKVLSYGQVKSREHMLFLCVRVGERERARDRETVRQRARWTLCEMEHHVHARM